ncbi:hypothetical protein VSR69_00220 [Paraburkholderia phytofirmans]|jgi:hypothetical protein|uniref:hypothetical protein n=1 Tax=Paraburkholderia sp. BL9I2N2 TaxID=1938809 RepID=UPI00104B0D34|nr:hypothetical protein [Paraburkholderia sp. BL9I2N2]TCK87544.1 hypothetical protein B0G74_8091 [Paraburkholderia sp. BL9I2N2]
MKVIRHLVVAAALGVGLVSCAEAHVFVGVGVAVGAPAFPMVPVVPVVPAYVPPPVYYAAPPPPPPVYTAPVVIGYYGHPQYPRYYGGWGYGYGYWRR